jgi:hypothetical protein
MVRANWKVEALRTAFEAGKSQTLMKQPGMPLRQLWEILIFKTPSRILKRTKR